MNQTATATNGGITVTGTAAKGVGVTLIGALSAEKDIIVDGTSSQTNSVGQGVLIQNEIKSNAGNITVTGVTNAANQPAVSLYFNGTTSNGSLKTVAANKNININADTLYIDTKASVDAGSTGVVTIQTTTVGNKIALGVADTKNSTPANRVLGLDNGELARITAGKLVIGANNQGNVTVASSLTTNASTGNLTLLSGGNIAVDAALTVGDNPLTTTTVEAAKNLTLDAGGAITNGTNGKLTATELILKAGSTIGADGAAIKTNVEKASLTSAGSQFLIVDNKVTVAAKTTGNGDINITTTDGTMTVGTFNGVTGIDAGTGNVGLTAASGLDHGIYMSSDVKGKDITVNATANNGSGLGFYGAGGSFTASGMLNLTGTATGTGNGFYSFGGTHTAQTGINITGTSANGQGVGFDKNVVLTNASNDIVITGTSNGAGTNTEAIGLRGSSITNTNGNIKLVAVKGNVFTNSEGGTPGQYWGLTGPLTNTITNNGTGEIQILAGATATDTGAIDGKVLNIIQNGNGGVLVKTTGTGNVIAPKITNAGTGNVVIAAGSELLVGNGLGGQVQTVSGNTISQTNTTPGKTYIYSGSAANTGALGNLDSTLGALKIDGTATQNADTNVAYNASSLGIAGSTAPAQVMFREKLTISSTDLVGVTVNKTYGDPNTGNTATDATALLGDVKSGLKNVLSNQGVINTTTNGEGNNNIQIFKSVVIDSLGGTLNANLGNYSTSSNLKANADGYQYSGGLASTKYTASLAQNDVKVVIGKRTLTDVQIASAGNTYGDTVGAGAVTFGNTKGTGATADKVTLTADVVSGAGDLSTSGNLKAGSYAQKTTAAKLAGADSANYTVADTTSTANYTVGKRTLDNVAIGAAGNTYGDTVGAGAVTFGNTKGTGATADKVTLTADVVSGAGDLSTSGNLKAGSYAQKTTAAKLAGADSANYTVADTTSTANYTISKKALIISNITASNKTYNGDAEAAVSTTAVTKSGLVGADDVTVSATGKFRNDANTADDKNVKLVGGVATAKTVALSSSYGGSDRDNYAIADQTTSSAVITKANLAVTLADQTKTYDGTTAATLVPSTFTVKGVTVAGQTETASVNQTVAFYNDKNVLRASSVTVNLAVGNFAAATDTDLNNYNLPTTVTGKGTITPRPWTIAVGTVADKSADGTTTATVTPGALSNLVAGESLGVSATGNFSDANVGNGKVVTASYTLRDGTNGLASNYMLNANTPNPDSRLRGNILAAVNPVTPIAPVNNNTGSVSRVRTVSGFGGAGAATGVLDDKAVTESREVCSDVFPENCECQPSVIPSIEICFAPKSVAATKEEK